MLTFQRRGGGAVGDFVAIEPGSPQNPSIWLGTMAQLLALGLRNDYALYFTLDGGGAPAAVQTAAVAPSLSGGFDSIAANGLDIRYLDLGTHYYIEYDISINEVIASGEEFGALIISGLPFVPTVETGIHVNTLMPTGIDDRMINISGLVQPIGLPAEGRLRIDMRYENVASVRAQEERQIWVSGIFLKA